jgi:hypothetical protein
VSIEPDSDGDEICEEFCASDVPDPQLDDEFFTFMSEIPDNFADKTLVDKLLDEIELPIEVNPDSDLGDFDSEVEPQEIESSMIPDELCDGD